jgi:serine protease AprX
LTILAGWQESSDTTFWFYGSAHGASFILCHTESDASETSQEEDNWVAAMEYADSIGADLFSTSLGYRDFDGGFDYGYQGMDGNTTIITRGADLAAAKGIVVVNSAGNSGANHIIAPADGDSVIAIGAVDSARVVAGFSSQGPSYDQRVKPDICAMGLGTSFANNTGVYARGNGTSFSCPVASGMMACLLQSAPNTGNMELYQAVIRSADHYDAPDSLFGYGIPYAPTVYKTLTGEDLPGYLPMSALTATGIGIFPNPITDRFTLIVDNEVFGYEGYMEMFDMQGRKVWFQYLQVGSFYNVFEFDRQTDFAFLPAGRYAVRINNRYVGKLTFLTQR